MSFDRALASDGYLRTPEGEFRHVLDLDRLFEDIDRGAISVAWAEPLCTRVAWFSYRTWTIYLAPWLVRCPPWFIRDVIGHELGHALIGRSDTAVRLWQERYLRELPVDVVDTRPPVIVQLRGFESA